MKPTPYKRLFFALATALTFSLLSACGGETTVADGGIRGTGSSVGPVSGFGSVFVNGVEFFTDGIRDKKVNSNDGVEAEGDLNEGMILRIEGDWHSDGTGKASSMAYDDTLRGPVSKLVQDPSGDRITFEIYGQQVSADRQTVFKGKSLISLENEHFVRVSAWRQPGGVYRASYIGYNPSAIGSSRIELEGAADTGSVGAGQFKMNGFVIKFDDNSFAQGLTSDDLKPGVYFEVEGKKDPLGVAVVATRIQLDDFRRYRPAGKDIEIAGPISSDYNANDKVFGLNGLTIEITDKTERDDIALTDLNEGLLVQVEGEFVTGDLVVATEIEARDGDAEITGAVDSVNSSTDSLLVGGVRVLITPRTIITDDDTDQTLTIDQLIPGTGTIQVEVSGLQKEGDDGKVYVEALQIERELAAGSDGEYELEGVLAKDGLSYSSIIILGISIDATDDAFEDISRDLLEKRLKNGEKLVLEIEYKRKANSNDQYEASSVDLD